jgi:hypothetical protein
MYKRILLVVFVLVIMTGTSSSMCGNWGWGDIPPPPDASTPEIVEWLQDAIDYYEEYGCYHCGTPDGTYASICHCTFCPDAHDVLKQPYPDVPLWASVSWLAGELLYYQ